MRQDPENSIFKHRIFRSDAYKSFETNILVHVETTPTSASMVLCDTIPIIEQLPNEVFVEVKTTVAAVKQRLNNNHLSIANDSILAIFQWQQAQITNAQPAVSSFVVSSAVAESSAPSLQHTEVMYIDGAPPAFEVSDVMLSKGTYTMLSKGTYTIKEFWKKWMACGSNATKNITVEALNRLCGTKWCNSQKANNILTVNLN